jgi:glycosyltransferase involved in cell wall biosynthesis
MVSENTGYSIILPCYNEEAAVASTIAEIKKTISGLKGPFEIIAVNDASKDKTLQILEKISGIRVINNQKNLGYGASIKKAMLQAKGEYIIITDSDSTYPIKDITKLVALSKEYDMVVGARIKKGAKIPLMRRPAKWFLGKLANYVCGYNIPDLNSGFRVFRKDMAMRFYGMYPEGVSLTTTITVAALTSGYNVKYFPIDYYKRSGKSHIKPISSFITFTTLILRLSVYFRPLNIFIPTSFILMLGGGLKLIHDYITVDHLGVGGFLFLTAGIQLLFMGLLADLIIRRTEK